MRLTIYLAASVFRHEAMRQVRDELIAMGHEVRSRWIDFPDEQLELATSAEVLDTLPEPYRKAADSNLVDLTLCDTLVVFTDEDGRGGRHVEFGFALAYGKTTIVVGPLQHMFHTLARGHFDTIEEFLTAMRGDQ